MLGDGDLSPHALSFHGARTQFPGDYTLDESQFWFITASATSRSICTTPPACVSPSHAASFAWWAAPLQTHVNRMGDEATSHQQRHRQRGQCDTDASPTSRRAVPHAQAARVWFPQHLFPPPARTASRQHAARLAKWSFHYRWCQYYRFTAPYIQHVERGVGIMMSLRDGYAW